MHILFFETRYLLDSFVAPTWLYLSNEKGCLDISKEGVAMSSSPFNL